MHAALRVQEILLNIFGRCYSPITSLPCSADLAALARTCRAFKEPALDILWSELTDLSPIPRCLPEICQHEHGRGFLWKAAYGFSRPLQEGEWHILRSYSRRIRCIRNFDKGLYRGSVEHIINAPTSEPLFPNVRYLYCSYKDEIAPLLCLPFPSLTTLSVKFFALKDFRLFQGMLESFAEFSPNISSLDISTCHPVSTTLSNVVSNHVCCWSNLHTVDCDAVALGVDAFIYLSHMSTLTLLSFTLSTTLLDEVSSLDPPPSFSSLRTFIANSGSLIPITSLLSCIRLPAVTSFSAYIHAYLSKETLATFFASLQTCTVASAIERLRLVQLFKHDKTRSELEPHGPNPSILCFDDLRPLMAFGSLEDIDLDLGWDVGLVDSELVSLGQAWPTLRRLCINKEWGWVTPRVTPHGLAKLLWTCPLLAVIGLAIDARGFTEPPPSLSPNLMTLPYGFSIDVIDSPIEEESIPAMAAFIASIMCYVDVFFTGWEAGIVRGYSSFDETLYGSRWKEVYALAGKIIKKEYSKLVKTSSVIGTEARFLEDKEI